MVAEKNSEGYKDWLVQRVTALLIGTYTLFLIVYFIAAAPLDYVKWYGLFHHVAMKIATFIVVISVLWHAWIGLWTVFTDYINSKIVRLILEIIICILLVAYFAWILDLMWGY